MVAEDDPAMQTIIRVLLESQHHEVVMAGTAAQARRLLEERSPALALLDLGLPDQDGIELIQWLRLWSAMPILVISARTAEAQRLQAFELGADDYILKPFSGPELLARIRSTLRRQQREFLPDESFPLGPLMLSTGRRTVQRPDGSDIRLTPLEYRLLEALARHPNRLLTHADLTRSVWGATNPDTRGLRVLLASLRRKLQDEAGNGLRIEREIGVGYRLRVPPSSGEDSTSR